MISIIYIVFNFDRKSIYNPVIWLTKEIMISWNDCVWPTLRIRWPLKGEIFRQWLSLISIKSPCCNRSEHCRSICSSPHDTLTTKAVTDFDPKPNPVDKLTEETKIENLITESSDSDESKRAPALFNVEEETTSRQRSTSPNLPELVEVANQVWHDLFDFFAIDQ